MWQLLFHPREFSNPWNLAYSVTVRLTLSIFVATSTPAATAVMEKSVSKILECGFHIGKNHLLSQACEVEIDRLRNLIVVLIKPLDVQLSVLRNCSRT